MGLNIQTLQPSDFPSSLTPIIHKSTQAATPENVVLFFPGLGDSAANFSNFARALNLPDVVAITLQPTFPLPFPIGPGNHWSEDLQFDQAIGALDPDSPLTFSTNLIANDVISKILIEKCNLRTGQIHLFGFGQGGSLALSIPLHPCLASQSSLGSVISIGGILSVSAPLPASDKAKNRTSILLLGGSKGALAADDQSPIKRIKHVYEFVEYHQWRKNEDSMPKTRDEVLPMMRFLARRLKSRRGVPDDAVEIS